ncbi:hypothetical protein DF3PA_70034 [Candidatus Defluviicoccus seviourii]|uniref:Uncharacterized protein n=1 Tax=Candidatus Defluviicoccus seviourii TaxID=2565273 RepID=A0A564WJF7_9PROT|nr:hypothetical protein DF3PA_70034 [Candidatus Defluviicoccus seviourii]
MHHYLRVFLGQFRSDTKIAGDESGGQR